MEQQKDEQTADDSTVFEMDEPDTPEFKVQEEGHQEEIPMAQPVLKSKPKGEKFKCPECGRIFIVALSKRPLHIRCPYCQLEGIVD